MSQSRLVVILAVAMFLGGIVALVVGIVLGVMATHVQDAAGCQPSREGQRLQAATDDHASSALYAHARSDGV